LILAIDIGGTKFSMAVFDGDVMFQIPPVLYWRKLAGVAPRRGGDLRPCARATSIAATDIDTGGTKFCMAVLDGNVMFQIPPLLNWRKLAGVAPGGVAAAVFVVFAGWVWDWSDPQFLRGSH
jgi:hypothetical protein